MSHAHLAELRVQLERRQWKIVSENKTLSEDSNLNWIIARPNGDSELTLEFSPGSYGLYGQYEHDSIDESIACCVVGHNEIQHLYFGKFHGQYQKDVVAFADEVNDNFRSLKVDSHRNE